MQIEMIPKIKENTDIDVKFDIVEFHKIKIFCRIFL